AITTADSEPEPDIAIVSGTPRSHLNHHPVPTEIALVIEVADSSLTRDRQDKGRLFARAGIACYWIINLTDRQVQVYTDPTGRDPAAAYRQQQVYRVGDAVPLVVQGNEVARVAVVDLLP